MSKEIEQEDWCNKDDFDGEFWENHLLYYYDDRNEDAFIDFEDENDQFIECIVCVRLAESEKKFEVRVFHADEYDDIDIDWEIVISSISNEIAQNIKRHLSNFLTSIPAGKNYSVESLLETLKELSNKFKQDLEADQTHSQIIKNYYLTKTLFRLVDLLHKSSANQLKIKLKDDHVYQEDLANNWSLKYISRYQKYFDLQKFREENPEIYEKYCLQVERSYLFPLKNKLQPIDLDVVDLQYLCEDLLKQLEKISNK